jgi:LacI family transcriptional regulator, galactose operon repressor
VGQRTKTSLHPTIYDVARFSGVSISTVSRVVNAPQMVSEETRTKVMEAVARLGFVPKAEASLRARRNVGSIGVLLPFFTSPSFVQRMRGVAAALAGTEYELIVYTVESAERLHGYLDSLPLRRRLDGLILMSLPLEARSAQHILTHGLETVLIEVGFHSFCSVEIDNGEGGRIAARYLVSKGYRRCAFIGESGMPAYTVHTNDLRLSGYREILEDAGIGLSEQYVNLRPYTREGVVAQTCQLLSLDPPPDAVFAYSDLHAADILKAAREKGLRIPDDLAVVGFDGTDIADYLGLTTVDQGLHESGRLAAELLMSRIADRGRPAQIIRLQPKVIGRLSA